MVPVSFFIKKSAIFNEIRFYVLFFGKFINHLERRTVNERFELQGQNHKASEYNEMSLKLMRQAGIKIY
jgi:hypothetical protein